MNDILLPGKTCMIDLRNFEELESPNKRTLTFEAGTISFRGP